MQRGVRRAEASVSSPSAHPLTSARLSPGIIPLCLVNSCSALRVPLCRCGEPRSVGGEAPRRRSLEGPGDTEEEQQGAQGGGQESRGEHRWGTGMCPTLTLLCSWGPRLSPGGTEEWTELWAEHDLASWGPSGWWDTDRRSALAQAPERAPHAESPRGNWAGCSGPGVGPPPQWGRRPMGHPVPPTSLSPELELVVTCPKAWALGQVDVSLGEGVGAFRMGGAP